MYDEPDDDREWRDLGELDAWVTWLKVTFGLPPSIVPPYRRRHDGLVWELSALHTHWLSCYHETASPSVFVSKTTHSTWCVMGNGCRTLGTNVTFAVD